MFYLTDFKSYFGAVCFVRTNEDCLCGLQQQPQQVEEDCHQSAQIIHCLLTVTLSRLSLVYCFSYTSY